MEVMKITPMDDMEMKCNFTQDNQKSLSLDRKLLCYKNILSRGMRNITTSQN
jgi:hypothetical protein